MAHWLMKSEPGSWSWDDQVRVGVEPWNGVRNHQAAANMKAMRLGDPVFFYHSVNEKRIVGIAEVAREYYPDPTDPTGRFGMVDVRAVCPVPRPVTLAEIKAEPRLAHLALIRQSRLSVMPIDDEAWELLCAMGGVTRSGD
jgi:predicted RNA-binding protein with PUA-like domain